MPKQLKYVQLYTDGACSGNPGPGGYGTILVFNQHRKEVSGGYQKTTNNRMEIIAVLRGLKNLKEKCKVTVYSDSKYVVDAMTLGWVEKWQRNGWKRNKKDWASNIDLWERMLDLCEKHEVEFKWVKGHAGHPENERCDEMAVAASKQDNRPIDKGYENSIK
ncbi:MAG: ribonuclease HI [Halanaerobiales bacterium]|nr:ribonuclease HI [Halanaerobiales bacterium]